MSARHLLSVDDLSVAELMSLTEPECLPSDAGTSQRRGTLAFMFQQPSLRTMSSFASAGVQVGLSPVAVTTTGGPCRDQCDLVDEIHQLGLTSTCVVARTSSAMTAEQFKAMRTPLVNAGDGSNEHPSQALLDLASMRAGGLEGKRVLLLGNLRDHRVHHSLVKVLQRLDVPVRAVCPPTLTMPTNYLSAPLHCVEATDGDAVDDELARADYVYMTPGQFFTNPDQEMGPAFRIDHARAARVLKRGAIVLHPFPRLNELAKDVDGTRFDGYSRQTAAGPEIRRRILELLLR